MEIVADDQRQRALKTTEAERGQEKDDHQQTHLRLAQGMDPLIQMRPNRCLGAQSWFPALCENEKSQNKIGCAQGGGHPAWTGISEMLQTYAANKRAKNKSQPKRHADEPHFARSLLGRRDIGNVSLGDRDIAAAQSSAHS